VGPNFISVNVYCISSNTTETNQAEKYYLSLLFPSGLQASDVISFPVFSLGGKLHTRWKLASRCKRSWNDK